MDKVIIIRYGEIILKGLNKRFFEDKLVKHIRQALKDLGNLKVYKEHSRIYVDVEEYNENEIIDRVKRVFGVVSISPAKRFPMDMDIMKRVALEEMKLRMEDGDIKTFKVESKRGDKNFPMKSPELSREIGGFILSNVDQLAVDVHNPDVSIHIEVRNWGFVFSKKIEGFGGLPLGTNGKALLLLSGGIDSPVAGWLVGKRGVEIEAIHFHSYPFTSERAKEKVVDLAKLIASYCGNFKLRSINLLPIQKEINEKCPEEEMTILSRRFMMKIAEKIAQQSGCDALVTGESIGQVASQTVKSLHVTNAAVEMPVFRPLIAMDKVDIMDLAKKIGTYETSILPFEDCCTVFLPKHPITQPRLERILHSEGLLNVEELIDEAIENMEEEIIQVED
ncbi:tRNA uracil 4-sulfurtransferase ThiI [Natronincola ferrireducens]|uniref:Probable tRNA sulfurtransferase n=1 Tax=Natronincola ferrireducens TaxID=393762 RepID=A0A1G9D8G7_9FIRM|nr:tRNA uracil 4-sulfurtransferase ThiI [Natronincola ferrireducens]SDK60206.1 thiamine biosynthesis protein ThiI [Natronincola ferrireducens]